MTAATTQQQTALIAPGAATAAGQESASRWRESNLLRVLIQHVGVLGEQRLDSRCFIDGGAVNLLMIEHLFVVFFFLTDYVSVRL